MAENREKILFITLTNIGDTILTTALLDRIIHDYPNAKVDVVCGPGPAPLLSALPCVDECYVVKKRKHHLHHLDMWRHFKQKEYDIIVDLRTPWLGKMLKAKKKIGFRHRTKGPHKAVQFCSVWPQQERPLRTWVEVPEALKTKVRQKTCQFEQLVLIAPTVNWQAKQWPQRRYAALIAALRQSREFKNATFALLGAPGEEAQVADLAAAFPPEQVLNLIGELNLLETAAWCEQADLFIGNDSGLAHLAGAVGTPTLTIFGPMYYDKYQAVGPYSEMVLPPVRPWKAVNLARDAYPRIITDITVEMVLAKALQMGQNLAQNKAVKKGA